ncbi:hypothetical protein N7495_008274 [Penicillium taxi]|uniref:uncharacterized protein n=1 Tax=Penicillium taxi TaxID=168475 RepID=UPI0025451B70|nr:uncharacterized protein N7495_008274 [Penicillium taxi]KAJ5888233.1 hypothetical protein N7495_008274 [Penicillium taxi]
MAAESKQNRGRGQGGQPRSVQISKALSRLLRHAAEKEGLKMNTEGYANVADVLQWQRLRSIKCTFDEIKHAVALSDKKRFGLLYISTVDESMPVEPTPTDYQGSVTQHALSVQDAEPSHFLIRATQGHSIKTVEAASLLEPLSLNDESKLPDTVVHGTFHGAWESILKSGGLKSMSRNHVHFATGPSLEAALAAQQEQHSNTKSVADKTVISGMRWDAQVLIYIDIRKALAAGCPFWRSENGVILSEGLSVLDACEDKDEAPQKIVPVDFFDVVVERKSGLGKIWEHGKVLKELPETLTKRGNPKGNRK